MGCYILPFSGHFPQKPKYLAIVYTSTSQYLLRAYATKQITVAYLQVNTLSFRHRIIIYKNISFSKSGTQSILCLLFRRVNFRQH